ncbi:hypothetical protein B6N13_14210 [Marinomonas sp. UCMA 3892]|uniref:hypothetical protein n=1 Tax=Marinomonas sp. UCMA 3892 TaxID=1972585 RepID=UPI00146F6785|nr:hypothetical protein [Marinomonas sp. UCMA 3892]NLU99235.1 hypothetical protein [Marinomonas sp. UCMA 3892]
MLHLEFAVSPEQVRSIHDINLLEARFGFHKGALISLFPKKWIKSCLDSLTGNEIERKQFVEKITANKDILLSNFGRNYGAYQDWSEAAWVSHSERSFHKLIDRNMRENNIYLDSIQSIADNDMSYSTMFPRCADSLALAARALLLNAEKVTLYDPYFDISNNGCKKTLKAMMEICQKPDVEFHIYAKEGKLSAWRIMQPAFESFMVNMINERKLFFYSVDDNGSGFMHDRGLFTVKGGLIYDRGFLEPHDHTQREELTNIIPMPISMLEAKSKSFNEAGDDHGDFVVVNKWASH